MESERTVMSDEEANKIARGFLDHQKEIEAREELEYEERRKKREERERLLYEDESRN